MGDEKFRDFAASTSAWEFWLDPADRLLWVSPSVLRITGYTMEECFSMPEYPFPMVHPGDVRPLLSHWQGAADGSPGRGLEFRIVRKDGRITWGSVSWQAVRDEAGTGLGRRFIVRDVTTRRTAEQQAGEREGVVTALLNAPSICASLVEPDGTLAAANDFLAFHCGTSPEELVGKNLGDILPAEVCDKRFKILKAVLASGQDVRFVDEDTGRVMSNHYFPVFDEDGKATKVAAFATDITKEQALEDELRRREKLYRGVVEDQTELICRYTPDHVLTFVNDAYARYFGQAKDELIGASHLACIPEQGHGPIRERLRSFTAAEPAAVSEQEVRLPDGRVRWQQWSDRAIFDEGGRIVEFQSVGRDITERVLAERKLAEVSLEKGRLHRDLEAVFRSIPDGILTVDKDLRIIQANAVLKGICPKLWAHPHDRPLARLAGFPGSPCHLALAQTIETGKPVLEYRAQCCKAVRPEQVLMLNCAPLLDESGGYAGAVLVIRDVTRLSELERQLVDRHSFRNIIGKSGCMQAVYTMLERLADLDTTVLITGESGTGKELLVDALHYNGHRSSGSLVKVNCSALSESVLESELFGHVKGAFTGADRDRIGRFEKADGGTLFLDEIGDISPSVQVKLLRALEQKEFERVGDTRTRRVDARIIAATNADLEDKVRKGLFRADLYFRLKVMALKLPPLRERTDDIPLLVEAFIGEFRKTLGKTIGGVSDEAMRVLMNHPWPGNVRELRHSLEHACVLCAGGDIRLDHLPEDLARTKPRSERRTVPLAEHEDKAALLEALGRTGWNKAKTARLLGMSRLTLYRKLKKFGLSDEDGQV